MIKDDRRIGLQDLEYQGVKSWGDPWEYMTWNVKDTRWYMMFIILGKNGLNLKF